MARLAVFWPRPQGNTSSFFALAILTCVASAVPLIAFRPGLMNRDSFRMYRAAIGLEPIDDWNSPALTLVLRALHTVGIGPSGYVLLQSALFFGGIFLLCRARGLSVNATVLVFAAVTLFPPTLPWLATVEKSVSMGSLTVLLVGVMSLRRTSARFAWSDVVIVFTAVAMLLCRPNAIALTIPLVFFWRILLSDGALWTRAADAAIISSIVIGSFLLSSWAIWSHYDVQRKYPEQPLFVWDLAAISLARNEMLIPKFIYNGTLEQLSLQHNSQTSNLIFFPELNNRPELPSARRSDNPEDMRNLRTVWFAAIKQNPGSYLRHRWGVFLASLSLDLQHEAVDAWHHWGGGVDANSFGIFSHSMPSVFAYYFTLRETLFFRQFPYLIVLVLFAIWFSATRNELGVALSVAALIYGFHHILVATSPSLRNYYPVVFACVACAILAIGRPTPQNSET